MEKNLKNLLTNRTLCTIMTFVRFDGLSPNGKATDSDSVIFKVRILVAQLKAFRVIGKLFLLYRKLRVLSRVMSVFSSIQLEREMGVASHCLHKRSEKSEHRTE